MRPTLDFPFLTGKAGFALRTIVLSQSSTLWGGPVAELEEAGIDALWHGGGRRLGVCRCLRAC